MKKSIIITSIVIGAFVTTIVLIYSILSYNAKLNAKAVISADYSTITYDGKIYKAYIANDGTTLPEFFDTRVHATVDNRSFLWEFFLTDYIFISKDGNFIHLTTDYDLNQSDYYKLER